jgi:16S rRNA (adenine1518-N6/adenine1519-N6)-dimethyltransferase
LVELALAASGPSRMVVTLQEEVVDRLAARAGTDAYGLLTLLVGLRYEVREVFRVPRDCFFPVPDVESACAVLVRHAATDISEPVARSFVRLAKAGFGQRRKMLAKLAATEWPRESVDQAMQLTGIPASERAERVTREQFLAMATLLGPRGNC